jgi:hypothetical protein
MIGGGPAGLTATTYIICFHLKVRVVDSSLSRALWIPCTHNHAEYPGGISGRGPSRPDARAGRALRQRAYRAWRVPAASSRRNGARVIDYAVSSPCCSRTPVSPQNLRQRALIRTARAARRQTSALSNRTIIARASTLRVGITVSSRSRQIKSAPHVAIMSRIIFGHCAGNENRGAAQFHGAAPRDARSPELAICRSVQNKINPAIQQAVIMMKTACQPSLSTARKAMGATKAVSVAI